MVSIYMGFLHSPSAVLSGAPFLFLQFALVSERGGLALWTEFSILPRDILEPLTPKSMLGGRRADLG